MKKTFVFSALTLTLTVCPTKLNLFYGPGSIEADEVAVSPTLSPNSTKRTIASAFKNELGKKVNPSTVRLRVVRGIVVEADGYLK